MAARKPGPDSKLLPVGHDAVAPDGSLVRLLAAGTCGSMAHFELGIGETSIAQQHATVEELWFVTGGFGQMWRCTEEDEESLVDMRPGASLLIPPRCRFQFRNTDRVPLSAIGVTMPPWPGESEATEVDGIWDSLIQTKL